MIALQPKHWRSAAGVVTGLLGVAAMLTTFVTSEFAPYVVAIIVALAWTAFVQASYWRNSEILWTHALTVTSNNDFAHNNLAYLLADRGELDEKDSAKPATDEAFKKLFAHLQTTLPEVAGVRLSGRLKESAEDALNRA